MSISFEPIHAVVGSHFTAHTQLGTVELVLVEARPGDARDALRERFFAQAGAGDQSRSSRAIEMK